MTNWRNRMGEERLQALLQESLAVATKTGAMKPGDLARVIVDTTVQPKNITFPTDAKLLNRAREKLVKFFGCTVVRSEEHTSELQSRQYLVCRLLLEKKKKKQIYYKISS